MLLLNKIFLVISLSVFLFSYEKGNIDMHGGKENNLLNKKLDFAKNSIDYLLHSKSNKNKVDDLNKSKIKYLKIDDIEKIKF